MDSEDSYICATNRKSYPSVCRMVQDTLGIEQVSYAGRCDREECSGGPVSAVIISCRQSCYSHECSTCSWMGSEYSPRQSRGVYETPLSWTITGLLSPLSAHSMFP